MSRKVYVQLSILGAVALLAMAALVGPAGAQLQGNSATVALSGANEVPPVVDGEHRGSVTMTIDGTTLCFQFGPITLPSSETLPTAGHIHDAPTGVNGPVVVHIFGGGGGSGPAPSSYPAGPLCNTADPALIADIVAHPEEYYINLHNSTHPGGVMRGQLQSPCTITGSGVINGTSGPDVICGSSGADRIDGRGGDDIVYAGGGNDDVRGGPGHDLLEGGSGSDRLDGGTGDDILLGGPGNDQLLGGGGNDEIIDGQGQDQASGQSGRDRIFVEDGTGGDSADGGGSLDACATDAGDGRASCETTP